jgi:protein involved in polysaccharide export with SLBB domain
MSDMEKTTPTSYRLTTEARRILVVLADALGISQRAALEIALREMAKRQGIVETDVKGAGSDVG